MDGDMMESVKGKIAMLRGLRQVRQYSPKPVPKEIVNDILEVGRWTGSAMNRQPWEFVLVQDNSVLREISDAEGANSWLGDVQVAIVIVMAGESKEVETYDEARLTERLMLAAAAHGLGAGIWWWKDGGVAAKRILGIPEERRVRTAVGVGYPREEDATRPKKPDARKPMSEIVHEGKY